MHYDFPTLNRIEEKKLIQKCRNRINFFNELKIIPTSILKA